MTCQRALCANSDEKDDIEKDSGEKVPLNQESGSLDGKNDKNANSVNTKFSKKLRKLMALKIQELKLIFRTRNKNNCEK